MKIKTVYLYERIGGEVVCRASGSDAYHYSAASSELDGAR